jgi:hypothetical protein
MFTDDGVTNVTADGDAVYRINDKSGNGYHLTQATEAARPLYKTSGGIHWLQFAGTDDVLETGNITLTQVWSGAVGAYVNAISGVQSIMDTDRQGTLRHAQMFRTNTAAIQTIGFDDALNPFTDGGGDAAAATAFVATVVRAAALIDTRKNGDTSGAPTAATGTPQSGTNTLRLGASRSLNGTGALNQFLTGRIYGATYLGRGFSDAERLFAEAHLKAKIGL